MAPIPQQHYERSSGWPQILQTFGTHLVLWSGDTTDCAGVGITYNDNSRTAKSDTTRANDAAKAEGHVAQIAVNSKLNQEQCHTFIESEDDQGRCKII